ncbi:DUF1707 SHOCT-like domain-containing protein [Nocardioides ungokensis]|uniref:DUF1707 SHOCT-like domain-containing protein n=1 Tax=Nocardioides ungokensis TaxID=1643322 RepID=UPI0015E00FD9|nr:DUF1707 domain-containing protein [Nocardioides ungokensis]
MNDQNLRLSDVERDQAAAVLGEHYAQGRLTPEEHSERLDRIWAARTRGELAPVFSDLPSPYFTRPATRAVGGWPAGPPRRRGVPTPLLVVLAVLLVITVLTHLPIILIGLLVWFFVISRVRRHSAVRRW